MHHRIHDRRDIYGVNSEAEADGFVAETMARRAIKPFDAGQTAAYINDGRWVADCRECASGIAASPGVATLTCIECGARYAVVYPNNRRRIEAALLKRKWANRHWRPWETAADLERENKEHGVENPNAL